MTQQERDKIIDLVYDSENIEIANEILKGYDYLTLEDRREILCTGTVMRAIENPKMLHYMQSNYYFCGGCTDAMSAIFEYNRLNGIMEKLNIHQSSILAIDRFLLKKLGYKGARRLTRNKKQYVQFFCGKSKPSIEKEIKNIYTGKIDSLWDYYKKYMKLSK